MAGKKNVVVNFNEMRAALVNAHNNSNTKAITADQATGAGVSPDSFKRWVADVNALRETVWNYVKTKKNARRDATTEAEIRAARELIYPKWKTVLAAGEEKILTKQLHVTENDVEDLVGFAWCFMGTTKGTAEARVGEGIFRRLVEALVGCAIAKNEVLDDEDRDILNTYYGAQKSLQSAIDKIAELKKNIKQLQDTAAGAPNEEAFQEYMKSKIQELKNELAEQEKRETKAKQDIENNASKAQAIEDKMAKAV